MGIILHSDCSGFSPETPHKAQGYSSVPSSPLHREARAPGHPTPTAVPRSAVLEGPSLLWPLHLGWEGAWVSLTRASHGCWLDCLQGERQ